MGVEEGAVDGDAVTADAGPARLVGERGGNVVLELIVDTLGFDALVFGVFDGPAGDVFGAALDPPAVEHAERGHAVERRLHAAGAGGFIRAQRRVEPDIDAVGELLAEVPVVVLEVEDTELAGLELGGGGEDVADEALAGVVGGVSLAGHEELQAADAVGDLDEALGRVQNKAGALVGGDAAGEAEGQDVGVKIDAGALLDRLEEAQLAGQVGGFDDFGLDAVDRFKVLVIVTPFGNFLVEQLLKGLREPSGRVHAVGDGVDRVLREHLLRNLAVQHGDAVDVAREAQREVGHVEQVVVQGAEAFDGGRAVGAEDLAHLVEAELVVAGRDGCVSGEDALLLDGVGVGVRSGAERRRSDAGFEQANGEERGVALVHVTNLRLHAEGVQEVNAAEAENGLLAETVVSVAAVKVVGEAAVPGVVAVDVGVEEEDGDDVAGVADDVETPGAEGDRAALQRDGDGLVGGGEGRFRRPDDVALGLLTAGVEVLLEVAATVDERDGDEGNAGIGGGAEGIAGQHAEAARVGGQGLRECDLHGEVRDFTARDIEGGRWLGEGAGG